MTRTQALSWCVVAWCLVVATRRAVRSEHPPAPTARADAGPIAKAFADTEPVRRLEAAREFPGDRWSQDDHYHHQEEKWIQSLGKPTGLGAGELLRAIDDDLRARPPSGASKSTASPCKPRPVTD